MLDETKAKEKAGQTLRASKACQGWHDAYWALADVYAFGPQWGYVNPDNGLFDVSHLRHIVDPNRKDVRVSLNRILPDIQRLAAAYKPQWIKHFLVTRGRSPHNVSVKYAAEQVHQQHLEQIGALSVLREMELTRLVYGSVVLGRFLSQAGPEKPVNEKLSIKTRRIQWCGFAPWEFLRDPAADTVRPERDEEVFGHQKAKTVDWVGRTFGIQVKSETKLGHLQTFHQKHQIAQGRGNYAVDSEQFGGVVRTWYFKDSDATDNRWPWMLITWTDPAADHEEDSTKTLFWGKNPFCDLPYRIFPCMTRTTAPWGVGIPHIQMAAQDLLNIGASWLVRQMNEGVGKIVIESNTVEDIDRQLDNDPNKPIVWKRMGSNTKEPHRMSAPQVSPVVADVLDRAPVWMHDSLNLSGVQFGEAVKRGEAAKAYEVRLSEANATIEDQRKDHELLLQDFLYGDLCDVVKVYRADQLRKLTGGSVPNDQLAALKRRPIQQAIAGVRVHPTTMRPRTPREVKDEIVGLAEKQIIPPEDAQWEMMEQGGTAVSTAMFNASRKQAIEIDYMLAGVDQETNIADHHAWHIRALEQFMDSPQWYGTSDKAKEFIIQHWARHMAGMQEISGLQTQQPDNSAGSPSGEAVAAPGMAGSVAPAVNVA